MFFFRLFKARLLVELSGVFPKQISSYRAVRGDERVSGSSSNAQQQQSSSGAAGGSSSQ